MHAAQQQPKPLNRRIGEVGKSAWLARIALPGLPVPMLGCGRASLAGKFHTLLGHEPSECADATCAGASGQNFPAKAKPPRGFAFSPHELKTPSEGLKRLWSDM